ncbi:MAG: ABC transporter ATP-binding protein [Solirubrobacteraceae bacterium]
MSALALHGLSREFGGLRAVDRVDLTLEPGARHGLIGPNGAGKSTLFRLVTGSLRPTGGTVHVGERDITHMAEHARARLGIAQTFQHSSVFGTLSCRDNVVLALQRVTGRAHRPFPTRASGLRREADEALDRAGLEDRRATPAAALSHGERRQLELCIALACRPRLLLLDEPAAGMSHAETLKLVELIEQLPADITVLVIEHDLEFVFRVATDITVLHLGAVLASGPVAQIRASEDVQGVYLGLEAGERLFLDDGEPDGAA